MHSVTIIVVCLVVVNFYAASANPVSKEFGPINSEMPPYDVVSRSDKYEIRRYQPQLWAQVDYFANPSGAWSGQTSAGFMPLFQYITGSNERNEQIPMTAPVIMQKLADSTGQRRMAFIMPASRFTQLGQLPKPSDSNVKLVSVNDPLVFACIRFNMDLTTELLANREAELREAAKGDRVALVSAVESVRVGGYNPPRTAPELRTNDVCIPLVNQA